MLNPELRPTYPMQYKTSEPPVVNHGGSGPVCHLECDVAVWLQSAPCWLDAEHAVTTAVQIPLVDGLAGGGVYKVHISHGRLSLVKVAKVQHGAG